MVTYKNIRVKMKSGKSRIQRAMVLASGKLRFVKDLSRSRSSSAPRHKTTKKHLGGIRHMTRGRKGRSRGSLLKSAEKIGQAGALLAPHIDAFILKRDTNLGVYRLTGYHMATGTWNWHGLVEGWGPIVGFTVAAKAFHKIAGLIRRI